MKDYTNKNKATHMVVRGLFYETPFFIDEILYSSLI